MSIHNLNVSKRREFPQEDEFIDRVCALILEYPELSEFQIHAMLNMLADSVKPIYVVVRGDHD